MHFRQLLTDLKAEPGEKGDVKKWVGLGRMLIDTQLNHERGTHVSLAHDPAVLHCAVHANLDRPGIMDRFALCW